MCQCESFAIETPIFVARQADSPESLAFPIRANHATIIGDRKGTPKNFCDKDFAELSGELSGAICLSKPLFHWVMTSSPPELFRKFFGTVRAFLWLWGSFLALDISKLPGFRPPRLRRGRLMWELHLDELR